MQENEEEYLKKLLAELGIPSDGCFFDRKNNPISISTWLHLRNSRKYQTVAEDCLESIFISTRWIGHKILKFCTTVIPQEMREEEDVEPLAFCAHETEKEALQLHSQIIFLFDQKLWKVVRRTMYENEDF